MKTLSIFILSSVLLCSCAAQRHTPPPPVVGSYTHSGGYVHHTLDLRPDGTCTWVTGGCLGSRATICKWTDSANYILIRGINTKTDTWDDTTRINMVATIKKNGIIIKSVGEKYKIGLIRETPVSVVGNK